MATISIDYDSKGDVELILKKNDSTPLNQATQQASQSSEQENLENYNVGPVSVKVKEFRLRVSSLKLIFSSCYFQTMLESSRFREGQELNEHGFIEIELLDDPTAMMIVLGILYGNDIQVPTEVDLPTLEKVAELVDMYRWDALVAPHATSWFNSLVDSKGFPDTFDETLLRRLSITWLFGMSDHFKALSRVARQNASHSTDPTDEKAINERREVAFQKIEKVFEALKAQLLDREEQKKEARKGSTMLSYMVLGFATFVSQDLELGEFAIPDHAGSSIRSLGNRINLLQSMHGVTVRAGNSNEPSINPGGSWDLKKKLQEAIADLKMDEWGLDYDDFKT